MINLPAWLKKWLETSSPRQKLVAGLFAFSLLATGALLALNGTSGDSTDPLDTSPLWYTGVMVKLLGVLLLIVGSAALARRWLNLGPQGTVQRQLRLLETVRLSPRQALHLVAIGEQHILIGATDQAISLLTHLENGATASAVESQPQPAADFGAVLEALKG